MKKLFSEAEISAKYDKLSKYYDLIEGIIEIPIVSRFRKRLLSQVRGKVLDIGIGTGKNLKYYPSKCDVVGIDLSEGMLKIAEKRVIKLGLKVKLIKGSVEKLPFRSNEFDFVVDSLGLCTYRNPVRALKEMKRVCKVKGKVLLLEHGISNSVFIQKFQLKRESKHYIKVGCHLVRNPEELVKKARLKIVKAERRLFGIFYLIEAKKQV